MSKLVSGNIVRYDDFCYIPKEQLFDYFEEIGLQSVGARAILMRLHYNCAFQMTLDRNPSPVFNIPVTPLHHRGTALLDLEVSTMMTHNPPASYNVQNESIHDQIYLERMLKGSPLCKKTEKCNQEKYSTPNLTKIRKELFSDKSLVWIFFSSTGSVFIFIYILKS